MTQVAEKLLLWLNKECRIVSFHSVEGYEQISFSCNNFYRSFVQNLVEQGYRFQ